MRTFDKAAAKGRVRKGIPDNKEVHLWFDRIVYSVAGQNESLENIRLAECLTEMHY